MITFRLSLLFIAFFVTFFSCIYSKNSSDNAESYTDTNHLDFDDVCFDGDNADADTRNFDFDDIFFDEEDAFDFMNEYLDTTATNHMSRAIDPKEIMTILNLIGFPTILQTPFYLHTNIIHKRSLLDQPIFEPDRAEFPKKTVCGISAFIRKIDRSNFTKGSTKLSSYISLTEEILISRLQHSVGKITELFPEFNIDVEKIFNLFENMTVEERQAGFMLHFMTRWNKTTFRIFAPLYYLENNFSLTKPEQDAIAEEFGSLTPEEEKVFRKAHFVCDKIGMGDTRIEIDQHILKRRSLSLRCGAQATIPTAFTWGTGFLGSSFPKPSTLPTFDLDPLFNAIENPSAITEEAAFNSLRDFLLDSFDRLAANLLDVKLGNNRHLGLGAYIRTKTPLRAYINNSFAEKIKLTNRISVELFCPATEKRFYINKINEQAFDEHNFNDLNKAAENLAFLEEQMIERLFLRAFNTKMRPGAIFRWTNNICYSGVRHGFNLGTDFWIQDRDIFKSIQASQKTISELNTPIAKPPFGEQWKVFGGVVFKHKTALNTCFISLNGDITMNNKGIGEDWGLSLNFEASF